MRRHLRWLLTLTLVYNFAGEGLAQKKSFWKGVVDYFDSSNVKGVDSAYITQPDKPWALVLNSNVDQKNLEVSSTMDGNFTTNIQIKPPVSTSIGLWAGYRGWGAGYSLSLSGNNGYSFAMNMVSPSYGLNLRINRFSFDKPNASYSASLSDGSESQRGVLPEEFLNLFLSSPMKIGTLSFDGYWVFNKKRFSLLAAYDQSTTQLRSAGSLIAGIMYYYQKLDYDSPRNFLFIKTAGDVGLMKVYQGSVGVGYTYNWVPARGWVLNIVAMPVITLINKVKSSRYEIILPEDGYDPWDSDSYLDAITMRPAGEETLNGNIRLNLDLRMAASYCWRDWYVGATGQVHRFRSNNNNTTLKLTDWTLKAFIGMRL